MKSLKNGSHQNSKSDSPQNSNYKLVVLGEGGVGKSALTLQFVSHQFQENHDATIEDAYQQQAVIDGEPAHFDILDTAGQIEFTAMREQYMRCGEGFLICFSITDRKSFDEVLDYRNQILKVRALESVPLVLVATKKDLALRRQVSTEEGRTLASSMTCPFFETSAAYRDNVEESFFALVREIRRARRGRDKTSLEPFAKIRTRWKSFTNLVLWLFRRKRS